MRYRTLALVAAVWFFSQHLAGAADPFAENVRKTDPLAPEQQQKSFRLPPGFEIQLVAAEPDLRKPMNLAFDALGRLWYTESREYPFSSVRSRTPSASSPTSTRTAARAK